MAEDKQVKQLILAAMFGALAILFPIIFHLIGQGAVFLPMFFPILLMGFFVRFRYAVVVGFLVPYISGFLTKMPPLFPIGVVMSVECAVLAGTASILTDKFNWKVYPTMFLSIIAERIILVIFILLFNYLLPQFAKPYSWVVMIKSLPGIAMQIIFIPPIVVLLKKRFKDSPIFNELGKHE